MRITLQLALAASLLTFTAGARADTPDDVVVEPALPPPIVAAPPPANVAIVPLGPHSAMRVETSSRSAERVAGIVILSTAVPVTLIASIAGVALGFTDSSCNEGCNETPRAVALVAIPLFMASVATGVYFASRKDRKRVEVIPYVPPTPPPSRGETPVLSADAGGVRAGLGVAVRF